MTRNAEAHYMQSEKDDAFNRQFTKVLLILTISSLALSYADIKVLHNTQWEPYFNLVVVVAGICAATGAAIQYAMHHSESVSQHKIAGALIAGLRKELECLILLSDDQLWSRLADYEDIIKRASIITQLSPLVKEKIFRECEKRYGISHSGSSPQPKK